jgi:hypothetical protein
MAYLQRSEEFREWFVRNRGMLVVHSYRDRHLEKMRIAGENQLLQQSSLIEMLLPRV